MTMTAHQSFTRLAGLTDFLVDPDAGVIRLITEVPREAGAPDFYHFAGHASDTSAMVRQRSFNVTGGASTSRQGAVAKAIGEAVERYCSAIFDVEELPLHSYEDASEECVDPLDFDWYSQAQFDEPAFLYVPFARDTPVRWTAAADLAAGDTVWVPAATVFLPYTYYQGSGDSPIVQPISTGLSCHCSPAEAAVGAISEVVERDSFTIAWQGMREPRHVLTETLSDACYDLVARFERCGGSVTVLDITTDLGVPTILSVLRNDHADAAPLVFAASADASPETAAYKSLEELAHTGRYMQQIKTHLPRLEPDPLHENVNDQISHLNFWCDRANAHLAAFLLRSPERIEFDEIEDLATGAPEHDVRVLVERIGAAGHRTLMADLTTPDIADLGLCVVRAVVPGFHALFMDHRYRSLGCHRRWEALERMGIPSRADRETGNPIPHPYP